MHQQNLRQRLTRGSNITNSAQNDNNRHTSARFDTTKPFLTERLGNFAPVETRDEEPIEPKEINYARNNRCFKCKKTDQRARFCPQNKLQATPYSQLSKRSNQNQTVHNGEKSPPTD